MQKQNKKILIIDDDADVLATARMFLKQFFAQVDTEQNPASINQRVSREHYQAILLDMNFRRGEHDGREGLYWLERILTISPDTGVILITAYGDIELAVEAMKQGAADFVLKPWKNAKLLEAVKKALAKSSGQKPLPKNAAATTEAPQIIGQSEAMQRVFELVERVADTDANVLILGENGTGKELVARALHHQSGRRNGPFVTVDMGAVTASLMESELFGHTKGSFTDAHQDKPGKFETANGGTLFLDEIGNLSLPQQAKLLTVLQKRKVSRVGSNTEIPLNIRLVCATNMPLYDMLAEGRQEEGFRQDLLYRINTVEIFVPPLRERSEDIPLLVAHFLKIYVEKYNKPDLELSKSALRKLQKYTWPGNIRELQHAVERAIILSQGDSLQPDDFALSEKGMSATSLAVEDEPLTLDENEKQFIQRALSRNQGNVTRTAKELGLTRTALYRRLDKYGL
ncbi:MAG: sigma-54-dependent transcriptional regulator [Cyclobacteriaceae bacterium]